MQTWHLQVAIWQTQVQFNPPCIHHKGIHMTFHSKIKSLHKQAGYTLIELSISIAVIAVLVVSALYGVQSILDSNKINNVVKTVSVASVNINKMAAATANRNIADKTLATIQMGIWPDEVVASAGTASATVQNSFGSTYETYNYPNVTPPYFGIKINDVPNKLCGEMAAALGAIAHKILIKDSAGGPSAWTVVKAGEWYGPLVLSGACTPGNTAKKTIAADFIYGS